MALVHAPCTARDDWPAQSEALRRIGQLQPANLCDATIRAYNIFGFDAILRPTWISVARNQASMGTHVPWFSYRWKRLKNRAR